MKVAAVDPGLSGAAVVLEQIGGTVVLLSLIDLPTVGEGAKRRLESVIFASWLKNYAPQHAYVEAGRSMPRQGISSTFRYGRACGAVEGVIAGQSIPLTLVEASTWKKFLRLNSNKEDCRARNSIAAERRRRAAARHGSSSR